MIAIWVGLPTWFELFSIAVEELVELEEPVELDVSDELVELEESDELDELDELEELERFDEFEEFADCWLLGLGVLVWVLSFLLGV